MTVRDHTLRESGRSTDAPPRDRGTGYLLVDGTVQCVFTRFRLGSFLSLLFFWARFRRVRRQARSEIRGLLHTVLLFEDHRTCCLMSLWADRDAIVEFGGRVTEHVHAANWVFSKISRGHERKPEIWSAQFDLRAVSHNLNWDGVHLDSRPGETSGMTSDARDIPSGAVR